MERAEVVGRWNVHYEDKVESIFEKFWGTGIWCYASSYEAILMIFPFDSRSKDVIHVKMPALTQLL